MSDPRLSDAATMPRRPPFRVDDDERTILGDSLLHPDAIAEYVEHGVTPECFGKHAHGLIWQAMAELGPAADFITVRTALDQRKQFDEVGGPAYISALVDGMPCQTPQTRAQHARTVVQQARTRRAAGATHRAHERLCGGDDLAEVIADLQRELTPCQPDARTTAPLLDDVTILQQPARQWLIEGRIARGDFVVIAGPSGSGKSFVAEDLAFCTATGTPWLGAAVTSPGAAVYVPLEGQAGLLNRTRAWKQFHDEPADHRLGVFFWKESLSLLDDAQVAAFLAQVIAVPDLRLIIIDTWGHAIIPGDENKQQDVGRAIVALDRIRLATCATILVIHHLNAQGDRERGSTALRARADLVLLVKPHFGGQRRLTCDKPRDMLPFTPINFTLKTVSWKDGDRSESSAVAVIRVPESLMSEVQTAPSDDPAGLADVDGLEAQVRAVLKENPKISASKVAAQVHRKRQDVLAMVKYCRAHP